MINLCTHELIKDMVEHMHHLDKQRQRAIMDFMDYSFQLDKTKEYIEKLKEETAQTASSPCPLVRSSGANKNNK